MGRAKWSNRANLTNSFRSRTSAVCAWGRQPHHFSVLASAIVLLACTALNLRAAEPDTRPRPSSASKLHPHPRALNASAVQIAGSRPAIGYATYLGNPRNRVNAMALGSDGTVYVAGVTLA